MRPSPAGTSLADWCRMAVPVQPSLQSAVTPAFDRAPGPALGPAPGPDGSQDGGHDESIGDLIRGILDDVRRLVREEIALARIEVTEQVGRLRAAGMAFALAAIAAAFAATFLLVALALGVADLFAWPSWAGFLAVAALLFAGALAGAAAGRAQVRAFRPIPEETVSTIKENSEWIAKRLSSVRR